MIKTNPKFPIWQAADQLQHTNRTSAASNAETAEATTTTPGNSPVSSKRARAGERQRVRPLLSQLTSVSLSAYSAVERRTSFTWNWAWFILDQSLFGQFVEQQPQAIRPGLMSLRYASAQAACHQTDNSNNCEYVCNAATEPWCSTRLIYIIYMHMYIYIYVYKFIYLYSY